MRQSLKIRIEIHVFRYRQILIQTESLRHIADPLLHRQRVADHVRLKEADLPLVRCQEAGHESKKGRFSAAVRAHKPRYRPRSDYGAQAVQGLHLPARRIKPLAHLSKDDGVIPGG